MTETVRLEALPALAAAILKGGVRGPDRGRSGRMRSHKIW